RAPQPRRVPARRAQFPGDPARRLRAGLLLAGPGRGRRPGRTAPVLARAPLALRRPRIPAQHAAALGPRAPLPATTLDAPGPPPGHVGVFVHDPSPIRTAQPDPSSRCRASATAARTASGAVPPG